MGLFTFNGTKTGGDSYLGSNIQQRLRPLREAKLRIVQDQLGIDAISRPNSETCDISDTNSILRFLARENLDCAFNCEPDTSPSRVEELCNIILGTIPSGKYIHIIPHENTETAAREKRGSDMFGYFEVWIRDFPQKEIELQNSLTRFKIFFHQTIGSSPQ